MLKRHFHKRNLPHLYYNDGIYFITYRLYDSIHPDALKQLQEKLKQNQKLHPHKQKKLFKQYDELLDKSESKIQYLTQPEILDICKSSIHFYDGKEYKLICYCIMPNHIHLVFELINKEKIIGDIIGSIKKFSGRNANLALKRKGKFWQYESFDRLVRDDVELYFTIRYALMNPVNAGLVTDWKEWKGTYCRPEFQVID
jgi:REP element-mobilizing transposase RayT